MDRSTRNETIRALAAATAAAIRIRPARSLAAISGEIEIKLDDEDVPVLRGQPGRYARCTDRDLPLERTPNRFTGKHRDDRSEP